MRDGAAESSLTQKPGSVFHGRYEVVRCIKAGGMGAVYEVVDQQTRRKRALKVMLPAMVADADLRARFRLEATVAADVESEHIVEVFDAGVDADTETPFLVMELLKGEELAATLARRGPLPADEAVLLLQQAALALDRTHAIGVVHRDLKPENLFVTRRDDGSPRLKVLDFGIAKVVAQGTGGAKTTRSVGTPLYMSPEQIQGDGAIDHRADLYALGHIAFTILVGEAYWGPESKASEAVYPVLVRVMLGLKEPASLRAERRGVALSTAFDVWFAKATAIEARDRFDSASELVDELASVLGVALAPQPHSPAEPRASVPSDAAREVAGASPASNTQGAVSADPTPVTPKHPMSVLLWAAGAVVALAIAGTVAARSIGGRPGPSSNAVSPHPTDAASSAVVADPAVAATPGPSASYAPTSPAASAGATPRTRSTAQPSSRPAAKTSANAAPAKPPPATTAGGRAPASHDPSDTR